MYFYIFLISTSHWYHWLFFHVAAIGWNQLRKWNSFVMRIQTYLVHTTETTPSLRSKLVSSEVWRIMCHPSWLFSRVSCCRAALISLLTSTCGQLSARLFLWLCPFALPLFLSFFFFRTRYGEFLSPFLTFSTPAVNRLVSPSFASLIRPPTSYIIPRAGRGWEISTYIRMCKMNVVRRCERHFIKTTDWRFSFCPAAAPAVASFVRELKRHIPHR